MILTEMKLHDLPWTDISAPSSDDLRDLSESAGIPLRPLMSCLDSEHLPKYEVLENITFVILRVIDPSAKNSSDSIQKLTTKIAFFHTPERVYTIHRLEPNFLILLREKVQGTPGCMDLREFVRRLVTGSVMSYDQPLNELETRAEHFEQRVFEGTNTRRLLKEGYVLRRRTSSFRKVLKLTLDVIGRMASRPEFAFTDLQDLRGSADRLLFYTDDVVENITALLNLHLGLASQRTNEASFRTNEIMRVLTIFSVFFMPLSFIASVYGMNFDYMPELRHPSGYFVVLGGMAAVALLIFIWVYRHGWLNPPRDEQKPNQRKDS